MFIQRKINEWKEENLKCEERWKISFAYLRENGISHSNFFKLVEFIMCLPGTNAPTERLFSAMNNIWTAKKI